MQNVAALPMVVAALWTVAPVPLAKLVVPPPPINVAKVLVCPPPANKRAPNAAPFLMAAAAPSIVVNARWVKPVAQ